MTPLRSAHRLREIVPAKLGDSCALSQIILIYDRRLAELSPSVKQWVRRFPHSYAVTSGEDLKSLTGFERFLKSLSPEALELSRKSMEVWALGGGSVGDFSGFFASVWKRGVKLRFLPSTWLSAIDSSHGGKTGLNWGEAKNLIGTFYPASEVILVKELLDLQGDERMREGMGELAKIALIDGKPWIRELRKWTERSQKAQRECLWGVLPSAIRAKWKWIAKDPFEQKGDREVLNLGHTLGHILEMEVPLPHGAAVAQGLHFAIDFGFEQGVMSARHAAQARTFLIEDCGILRDSKIRISRRVLEAQVKKDKKRNADGSFNFIFIRQIGKPLRQSVTAADWIAALESQGWVKKNAR